MSKFMPAEAFDHSNAGYALLPFRFERLGETCILTNMVGEHLRLNHSDLKRLVAGEIEPDTRLYADLLSRHVIEDNTSRMSRSILAVKLRTKHLNLDKFTNLHIFVVTLRCEHSCPYCQVSRQNDDTPAFDMSPENALSAISLAFSSPSPSIKIEFQGGEPLLNFDLIRFIVHNAELEARRTGKNVSFVIATNLAVVTEEILVFCKEHRIQISTSLDGPADIHNRNRPRPGGDSYERTVKGVELARHHLGADSVSALMTTTKLSLDRVEDIIDEYLRLGFQGIFLRPLSPYGFAVKTRWIRKYDGDDWIAFYKAGLDYILDINRSGIHFPEFYTQTILRKMLSPVNPGYVDLMSPSGIGIAAVVYNYNGEIYASDEGRMLAEMGDKSFHIGNVTDSYRDIFLSDALLDPIEESFTGSAPMCSDCAYEPFCGSDPVYHRATQGDNVGFKPGSGFCNRHKALFAYILDILDTKDERSDILRRWVNR